MLGLVAGAADVLALIVVVVDRVILGVVAAPAAIVVCILALFVRVVVLGDLGAGALGIVRVLGLVAGALDVHHRGGAGLSSSRRSCPLRRRRRRQRPAPWREREEACGWDSLT